MDASLLEVAGHRDLAASPLDAGYRSLGAQSLLPPAQQTLLQGILRSLSHELAVIDRQGSIIAVNQAWERFASQNRAAPAAVGVGANYLKVCRQAAALGDRVATRALVGIHEVLVGKAAEFRMEYGCDSPCEQRWFLMVLTTLAGNGDGAVIAHIDITEQKAAEKSLRESERRYRTLFETMAQGVVYQDAAGNITDANPAAERILGLTLDQMQGRTSMDPRWRAIRDDGRPFPGHAHPAMVALRAGEPVSKVMMGVFNPLLGAYRWLLVSAIPQFRDGAEMPTHVFTTFEDITEHVQRENELEAIASVALGLRGAETLEAVEAVVLEQVTGLLHAAGTLLINQPSPGGEPVVKQGHQQWANVTGLWRGADDLNRKLLSTGDLYWTNDIAAESCLAGWASLAPVRAVAAVPLVAQGQALALLWVGLEQELTPGDLRVLRAVADMAASAMQRARLRRETELRMKRLCTVQEIDRVIISNLNLNVTLDALLQQVIEQLEVDAAAVLTLDASSLTLTCAAARGFHTRAFEQVALRVGASVAGRAALERRTIHVPALREKAEQVAPFLVRDERFVTMIAVPLVAKGDVVGVLEVFGRAPIAPEPEWSEFLQTLAYQTAIAINNLTLFERLQRSNLELMLAYDMTIEGWSRALDLRDYETEGHSLRVTELTLRLARAMGVPAEEMVHIRRGALLHDIGKMGIPDNILLKPGRLTDEEWEVMRRHPAYGHDLLAPITFLQPSLAIPYYHHERWDGRGYPRGLQREQIPLQARIFAVVDVWDALTSDRPYRPAWTEAQALAYIRAGAGSHFDPRVVEAFLKLEDTFSVPRGLALPD